MSKHRVAITPEMNAVLENMRHKRNDDLLSLADQLAEAARKLNVAIDKEYDADGYDLCKPWPERVKVTAALAAWDAARKGR